MVDTNKILTVSYGTFSCTLEGFDDSFGTMKAIAEYFRDLAADDRYFGAEPATPDAEMLARIAEKEISRRVEAHLDKNNIVLRADQGSILPLAMREPEQDQDTGVQDAQEAEASAPAKPEAPAFKVRDIEAAAPEVAQGIQSETTGIADQMAPLAQSVAQEAATPTAEYIAQEDEDAPVVTNEQDDDTLENISKEITLPAETDDTDDTDLELDTPEAEQEAEQPVIEEDVAEAEAFEQITPSVQTHDDTNSVADKLRRIRAVVSHDRNTGVDPSYTEDEHADDFLADTHQELEAALAIDDEAELAENAPVETSEDDISALLDRFGSEEGDSEDDEIFFPDAIEEAIEDDAPETAATPEMAEDVAEDSLESQPETEPDGRAPIRARIIKMKRVDFEAAVAAGGIEEDLPDDDTSLSDEEEEELLRELAAVEAELHGDDSTTAEDAVEDNNDQPEDDDAIAAEFLEDLEEDDEDDSAFAQYTEEDDVADEEDGDDDFAGFEIDEDEDEDDNIFGSSESEDDHAEHSDERHPSFGDDAESEMGRIFAEADTQMDEETGKGRRNAIAHLRAAVAAAKAEEGAGGKLKADGPDTKVYRDDLANVVRPRRPETVRAQTRRPETARPAPLKLVAEQRVDISETKPVQPVRPRRVAMPVAGLSESTAVGGDFAEYAETVGANSLPELLEAAAAYLSFVEGREQFSRPQLMTHVRQVEKDEFSREDGLRSFGQLLREGKIEKISGGRFKASENISYRPDARYAGE